MPNHIQFLCAALLSGSLLHCGGGFPGATTDNLAVLLLTSSSSATAATASPVNSVQTGLVDLSSGANFSNVTLTSVDMTKTFVVCSFRAAQSLPQFMPHCILNSPTNLLVRYLGACCNNVQVVYYVVEFASGASVQRGEQNGIAGLTQNIALSTVDTTKSFAIIQAQSTDNVNNIDEQLTFTADINGPTNLLLTRNEAGATPNVAWQVVQLDGATVQSGSTTISGVTSASPAITTVDVSKSFLILSNRGAAASNGNDTQMVVRGRLSTTSIALNRGDATNSVHVHYYVVTLDGSSSVQHGTETTPMTSTAVLTGIPGSSFDTTRSFPATSSSIIAPTADREQGDFTNVFSGGQLTMTRINTAVNASVDWQIVELAQ
ncbi:MAG: hypothetical protein H7A21_08615 [Spirochaetales bacterium]|nr:hypothetical protein [Spirochaetales bacterium]